MTRTQLYTPLSGPTLLSINADPAETQLSKGALARTDGDIEFERITVYMWE